MTTEISVMYASEKVKGLNKKKRCKGLYGDLLL